MFLTTDESEGKTLSELCMTPPPPSTKSNLHIGFVAEQVHINNLALQADCKNWKGWCVHPAQPAGSALFLWRIMQKTAGSMFLFFKS